MEIVMNEVEKNLQISRLLDYYGDMLTEKQRGFIDLYYNEDFSLAEIAEHENITRQGVRDSIKHGEQILCELESKLHLAERSSCRRDTPFLRRLRFWSKGCRDRKACEYL